MAVSLPPTLETLQGYVRDQLNAADRRAVVRWLGRCTDPRLPDVLANLQSEWRNELADGTSKSAGADTINGLFLKLLANGLAAIDRFFEPSSLPAILDAERTRAELELPERGGLIEPAVYASQVGRVWLVATTDSGDLHVLLDERISTTPRSLPATAYRPEATEGRTTFWLVVDPEHAATPPPTENVDVFGRWLVTTMAAGNVRVTAERITPPPS